MIVKRDSDTRGGSDLGWLRSMHTFSFGSYYDPAQMGFGPLRVINEDRVIPSAGFKTHPHNNMEIISYVLEGALAHKDSMGNGSIINTGDVQVMSAGSGVTHSEFNASDTDPVHFLQIWILPDRQDTEPGYQQHSFPREAMQNRLCLVASANGEGGSLQIKQDASLAIGHLDAGITLSHALNGSRSYWLQVARGQLTVNGQSADSGDGFAFRNETSLELNMLAASEVLLFDLPEA